MAIHRYIPNAKFIYLHRDPRDYALSQLKRKAILDDLFRISTLWQYEQIKCISVYHHLKDTVIKVSYEDLVKNEKIEIGRVCNFLGIEMLEQKKEIQNINTGTTEDWKNLNKQTLKNNFNKYKKELSLKQINIIENICWNEMMYLNYLTENNDRPRIKFKKLYKYWHYFSAVMSERMRNIRFFNEKNEDSEIMSKRNIKLRELHVNYRCDK